VTVIGAVDVGVSFLFDGGSLILDQSADQTLSGAIGYRDPTVSNVAGSANPAPANANLTKEGENTLVLTAARNRFDTLNVNEGVVLVTGELIITRLNNGPTDGRPTPRDGRYTADLRVTGDVARIDEFANYAGAYFSAKRLEIVTGFTNYGEVVIEGELRTTGTMPIRNAGNLSAAVITPPEDSAFVNGYDNKTNAIFKLPAASRTVTINGEFQNGAQVVFDPGAGGQTLVVGSLASIDLHAGAVHGHYTLDIDFANPVNSDKIVVASGGDVTGYHIFEIRSVSGISAVTRDTRYDLVEGVNVVFDAAVIELANNSSGTYPSGYIDAGIYRLSVVKNPGSVTTPNATLAVTGYSARGQFLINSAAAIPLSWFAQLDSVRKRQGELRLGVFADAPKNIALKDYKTEALWIRGYGQEANVDLEIPTVSKFTEYQFGVDVGADTVVATDSDYRVYAGVLAGFDCGRRNLDDETSSRGRSNSVIGGVYSTWLHRGGWFANVLAKGQYARTHFRPGLPGSAKEEFKHRGLGASAEFGKRFDLGGDWFVEASAEVAYLFLFDEKFTLNDGSKMFMDQAHLVRLGAEVRGGTAWNLGDAGVIQPHIKAGVRGLKSFGGDLSVPNGSRRDRIDPETDGVEGIVGAGVSWQFEAMNQIYLEYEAAFGSKYTVPWALNLGWRMRF